MVEELALQELVEFAYELATTKCQVSDASVLGGLIHHRMVRFSNNSVTVTKSSKNLELQAYVAKSRKRIIGGTSSLSKGSVSNFMNRLVKRCESLPESPDYVPLPSPKSSFKEHGNFDPKVKSDFDRLLEATEVAINSAIEVGARRVAGSLNAYSAEFFILTTGGTRRADRSTNIVLNLRAFSDGGTGHGLSCSYMLDGIKPSACGKEAGEQAKRSSQTSPWEEGTYDLILTPTVAADIIQHVGYFASAHAVDTGRSFLIDLLGKEVAPRDFSLLDSALVTGGLDCRTFDDEGLPTRQTDIVKDGILQGYLHNSTTAKKRGTDSTGHAGIIDPHPWNLLVGEGSYTIDAMVKEVKKGMLITNNWYTRFQNYMTGEYSTLPRDAAYMIENGEVRDPVAGMRISDSIPRQLKAIGAIGKERKWVKWWEVEVPTLAPPLLIREATVTRAQEVG